MAALRDVVRDYQEELRGGIAWVVFWREGTSWDGQSVYLDDDGLLTKDDRVALTEILQKDAHAVALNSYYSGQVTEDMTVLSGISEAKILEVKQTEIHEKASQSIKSKGWLPGLFRSIVNKAKDFLQNLIREHDMPPKPVLEIDMAEFRTMQKLMIKAQDKAKEIRHLQDTVLPKLKQQLADTKGIFKGKERKALTEQIQRTEKEIAEKLDKLPDVLKEDGYPDVQAYMATYRKAEAVVEQFNRDLAAWEQQVREKQKPAKKEQAKPPERESVLKRLRQLQAEGKQRNQPRQRKKSFDRDSR